MRILLDQSVHDHRNQGNNSLLAVTLKRFRNYWPDASYDVISNSPHLCKVYFPGTEPVKPESLEEFEDKLSIFHRLMPRRFWLYLFELREAVKSRKNSVTNLSNLNSPILTQIQSDSFDPTQGNDIDNGLGVEPYRIEQAQLDPYRRIANYDLYTATGGGYMCDSDKPRLLQMFDRLETAVNHGVPAVMVGQGVGPMEDPELLRRAKDVLPRLDYILIREECSTRPLLDSLNVPPSKVFMTGDDAIELAYRARKPQLGTGIGLSLRVAHYTGLKQEHIEAIRLIVIEKAKGNSAELIAAPIDVNDTDKHFTEQVMEGYSLSSSSWRKFEMPEDIIDRISKCRIMISGTFHGAVFALSQGIPVIGLAITDEYHKKLSGLTSEFGTDGCRVIHLGVNDKEQRLAEAIDLAWKSADLLRPQLLRNAQRQIESGTAAYKKIYDLLNPRN